MTPERPAEDEKPRDLAERIHEEITDSRVDLVVLRRLIEDEEDEEANRADRTRRQLHRP